MSKEHQILVYGSKNLSLDVCLEKRSASIRFGTNEPRWRYPHKENETTLIFGKADEILKELSKLYGPLVLKFDTANNHLKLWIEAKKGVFGFDEVSIDGEIGYRVTVIKKYTPQTHIEPIV